MGLMFSLLAFSTLPHLHTVATFSTLSDLMNFVKVLVLQQQKQYPCTCFTLPKASHSLCQNPYYLLKYYASHFLTQNLSNKDPRHFDHGSRIVDGSTLVSNSFQQQSELLILKYLYTFTKHRGRMHS